MVERGNPESKRAMARTLKWGPGQNCVNGGGEYGEVRLNAQGKKPRVKLVNTKQKGVCRLKEMGGTTKTAGNVRAYFSGDRKLL